MGKRARYRRYLSYFARSPKRTWALAILVVLIWNVIIQLGNVQYTLTEEDVNTYNRVAKPKDWSWFGWSDTNSSSRWERASHYITRVRRARALHETNPASLCQPIQVALLVSGPSETREVSQLMMTLLAQRTTPLIVHVFSDKETGAVLKLLFDTWQLHAVEMNYYIKKDMAPMDDMDTARTNIILNLHTLLDQDASVIVLTPRMRLNTDIKSIFSEFRKFSANETVGVRTLYRRNSMNLLVRAFSTDIVLIDTKRLRTSILAKYAGTVIKTSDDLSSVLGRHEKLVHPLPCSLNLRLDPEGAVTDCLQDNSAIKAVWWGPMAKHTYVNRRLELLKERLEELVHSDGELFRFPNPQHCTLTPSHPPKPTTPEPSDPCAEFRLAASLKRRTHLYYLGHRLQGTGGPYDVTMVTQLTLDRWGVLEKIVVNWKGPLSVVLYVSDAEAGGLQDKLSLSAPFANRTNIALHLVYKRPRHMAINYLRNVGISAVRTPFTLMMDVDLVPSPNMHGYLKNMLRTERGNDSVALVVPAFESFVELPTFPSSKVQVLKLWNEGKVNGFGMLRKWNLGHKPTDYEKWKTAKKPYFVEYQRAFEPYAVLPTKRMPKYDERFLDRMADKIIYAQEVFAQGYSFKVLNNCYVIHLPHPVSPSRVHWETSKTYKPCGFTFMKEIRKELQKRFPGKNIPFT